jgi:EamA domain-containing membrane protein RarD
VSTPASRSYFVAGLLLAIGGVVFFSLRPIFIKLAYAWVTDPVTLLALRMVFSVPFFVAAAFWVRSAPRVDIKVDAAPMASRRMLEAMLAKEG